MAIHCEDSQNGHSSTACNNQDEKSFQRVLAAAARLATTAAQPVQAMARPASAGTQLAQAGARLASTTTQSGQAGIQPACPPGRQPLVGFAQVSPRLTPLKHQI